MKSNVFIFHGTEGYPEENWFPWLKEKLEERGHKVFIPQFPTPPILPAKIEEWFEVLKKYEQYIDDDTIIIGHSLGGDFVLKVLEKLIHKVRAAIFVGTPVGVEPILNYKRDKSFSGFNFDWNKIRNKSKNFIIFHSDNDPYVCLENAQKLSQELGVDVSLISGAGHFNSKAGYIEFQELWNKLEPMLSK